MLKANLRTRLARILLWICVINWGIYIGGTLYQMLVIVPQWSATMPESLRAFFAGYYVNLNHTIYNFFGPQTMLIRNLPLLGALIFYWPSVLHRKYLLFACILITGFGLIFTLGYVYPINAVLFAQAGGNLSTAEISALAHRWIWADRIRLVITVIGYLAVLHAFSISLTEGKHPQQANEPTNSFSQTRVESPP